MFPEQPIDLTTTTKFYSTVTFGSSYSNSRSQTGRPSAINCRVQSRVSDTPGTYPKNQPG